MEIRKFFSDLRVQIFLAIMVIVVISTVIAFELLWMDLISYQQFDYGTTAALTIGPFIAVIVLTIRSKRKETSSDFSI